MIPFKNKSGFLSFEALIAVSIVGFFIIPLIAMQVSMRGRVVNDSRSFERLLFMTHLLHQARHEQKDEPQQFNLAATETDPTTSLTYELTAVSPQSTLSVVTGLLQEKIQAKNPNNSKQKTEILVGFIFRPLIEKEIGKEPTS